jgi:hypothetical protein
VGTSILRSSDETVCIREIGLKGSRLWPGRCAIAARNGCQNAFGLHGCLIRPPGDVDIGPGNTQCVSIGLGNPAKVDIQQCERNMQPGGRGNQRLDFNGWIEPQQSEFGAQQVV